MHMRLFIPAILVSLSLAACEKKGPEQGNAPNQPITNTQEKTDPKVDMQNAVEASCGNLGMMIVRTRHASAGGKEIEPVFSKEADLKILSAADAMLKLAKEAQEKGTTRKAGEYQDFKRKVQDSVLAAGKAVKEAAPDFFNDCEKDLGPNIRQCMTVLNPEKQRECMGQAKPKMVALVKKYDNKFKSLEDRARRAAQDIAKEKAKQNDASPSN